MRIDAINAVQVVIVSTRQRYAASGRGRGSDTFNALYVYRHLPASAHTLRRDIETTLLRYEPRLKAIDIVIEDTEPGMLLSFTMTCHLHRAGLVRFGTHFTPDSKTRLKLLGAGQDRC